LYKQLTHKPNTILLDRGYDAEWIHKYFAQQQVQSIAPVRKNIRRGFYRLALKRNFPKELYAQRNRVESIFHAFKTKYGSSVSSRHIASARSEVYCKAILHNIFLRIFRLLGQTLFQRLCRNALTKWSISIMLLVARSMLYANILHSNSIFCVLYFLARSFEPYFLFSEEKILSVSSL